ncbi:MAG: hypothetical protein Ct9H300mP32_2640 [Verrucomicrobiota bacterium]|nr:MAG: hypothetical protein Ct9H300mP32_2640 [Verrucomicrobiota bacterium]
MAIFFPVTDMLNLGKPSKKEKDGGPPKKFRMVFGIDPDDIDAWNRVGRELSPIHHIDADTPPVLIIHGDDDEVVSIKQSEWYIEASKKRGAKNETHPQAGQRPRLGNHPVGHAKIRKVVR